MSKQELMKEIFFLMNKIQTNKEVLVDDGIGIVFGIGDKNYLNGLLMVGNRKVQTAICNTALRELGEVKDEDI